jgi:hypothetical protein
MPPAATARRTARAVPRRPRRVAYLQVDTTPAERLLAQYAHTPCLAQALQAHTPCLAQALQAHLDGRSYEQAARHYGYCFHSFKRHMKHAARLLQAAYAS